MKPLLPAVLIFLCTGLVLLSCDSTVQPQPVDPPNPQTLEEAVEVWSALNLNTYRMDMTRSCECLQPVEYTVVVAYGKVVDVEFEVNPAQPSESKEQMKNFARSVTGYFDLIAEYNETAHSVDVEYDAEFGFPTRIFIDPFAEMADDEIIRRIKRIY